MKRLVQLCIALVVSHLLPKAQAGMQVAWPKRLPTPLFTGESLPVPPQQNLPWAPPLTDVLPACASAARALFDEGLADPRGCDYREIDVGMSEVQVGYSGLVTTHGWVLPGTNSPAFAVCWNGLVYPVTRIGAKVSFTADATNLLGNGTDSWASVITEGRFDSPLSRLGLGGCLLWRLGYGDLAAAFWREELQSDRAMNIQARSDPYLDWARHWTDAMYDRTISAHEHGDERLALLTARQLAQAQPKIDATCSSRGFSQAASGGGGIQWHKLPYLNSEGEMSLILADLERREKEGKRESISADALQKMTNQTERIVALIRDLDLVGARTDPSLRADLSPLDEDNPAEDPIIQALTREGSAAVEPLLDCLEHDTRLTRKVSLGWEFEANPGVTPVTNLIGPILEKILHSSFPGGAAEIRTYWNAHKGMSLQDRWYATLEEDSSRDRWLEAARNITLGENVTLNGNGWSVKPVPPNTSIAMQGKILRSKTNPSVTELMTRRALEIPADTNNYDLEAACQMGLYLTTWDPAAAEPVAKTLIHRVSVYPRGKPAAADSSLGDPFSRSLGPMEPQGHNLGSYMGKFTVFCGKTGDFEPCQAYADWLKTTRPEQLEFAVLDSLTPLCEFPTNEVLASAAEAIFGDTNSTWGTLPWYGGRQVVNPVRTAIRSALIHVPAFRSLLARELARTNDYGTFIWHSPGMLVHNSSQGSEGRSFTPLGWQAPADGTTSQCRWCDWIAWCLSDTKQIPSFNPFAPVETRDAEIRDAQAILRHP